MTFSQHGITGGATAPQSVEPHTHITLEGKMGVSKLVFTVLAMAAPIGAVTGVLPLVIGIGPGPGAVLVYLGVSLMLLLFTVGFSRLTRLLPEAGAFYTYITAGLGRPIGLGGAFVALVGYLCQLVGAYAIFGVFLGAFLEQNGGPVIPWWVLATCAWLPANALGHRNVEISGRVLSIVMILEVLVVLCLDIPVLILGGPEGRTPEVFSLSAFSHGGSISLGILFAISTFIGFESTAIYRRETRDPDKTIPRATYVAVIAIGAFYIVSTWALISAFGIGGSIAYAQAHPETMFVDALATFSSRTIASAVTLLVLTSVFASILSSHNTVARYIFSLAADGLLPRKLGEAHPEYRSPARASAVTALSAVLISTPFILASTSAVSVFSWLFGFAAYALVMLLFGTSIAVIAWFRNSTDQHNWWYTQLAPGLSVITLGGTLILVSANFDTLIGGSVALATAFIAAMWVTVIIGVIVALWVRRRRPDVYANIGRG